MFAPHDLFHMPDARTSRPTTHARRWLTRALLSLGAVALGSASWGADKPPEVEAAIRRGSEYLQRSPTLVNQSEAGLAAYTCLAAGEPPTNSYVQTQLATILRKFSGTTYSAGAHHTYEAGVDAMALVAADREKYKDQIQAIAAYIMREQRSHGGWDYPSQDNRGDTSITQYALLGLWAAARAGIQIPTKVWDNAAQWHLRTQQRDGAFGYHPLGGDAAPKHSMTVAGVGSLSITRIYLTQPGDPETPASEDEPEAKTKKSEKAFGVLERVTPKDTNNAAPMPDTPMPPTDFKPTVSRRELDAAIGRGIAWLRSQYTVEMPTGWHLYYLYGLERAASLTNLEKIGTHDWYKEGCSVLLKKQTQEGGWNDLGGPGSSTCFAILFLARATEKIVPNAPPPRPTPKAPTFGGGLLAGGRGLPTDLAHVDLKDGNVKAKKLDTPLDKLLAELENPKSQKIESAQAALVEAVQVGQREQLIGQKDLLLKLAKDPRVDVRRTAYWALGRCNDLRVAPVLIQGLMDVDYEAAVEARNALCVLSRRPRGFGLPEDLIASLPENASQAEKESAYEKWRDADVRRWREWYQKVRPYAERDQLPD